MASKAVEIKDPKTEQETNTAFGEMYFLAVPIPTYQKLSDEAARRGQTFAQALKRAFDLYSSDQKESNEAKGPRVLTETK